MLRDLWTGKNDIPAAQANAFEIEAAAGVVVVEFQNC